MNIRKNIDYSAMFAALDAALNAELPQMKLCCELGRIVCAKISIIPPCLQPWTPR